MAITADQRSVALDAILTNYLNQPVLDTLFPGASKALILSSLLGALGSAFDSPLTTVLNNKKAMAEQQLVAVQNTEAQTEADIAAWTVT